MPKKLGMLGKKVGMTRIYSDEGNVIAVTAIEAGPCIVLQKKSIEKDGYNAIQVGFANKKDARVNRPMSGHVRAAGKGGFYHVKEFRLDEVAQYELGQEILVGDLFKVGDLVDVSGITKGRGFQGVVKRYGFRGGCDSHGAMFHRAPGSIGCSAYPSRVIKGKKLPGRMGNALMTKKSVMVVDVRPETNVLLVKGCLPGATESVVRIYKK